jgi:quercetin dioxygenase-like cupin family protein
MKQKILSKIGAACPVGGITVRGDRNQWIKITKNLSVQILHQDLKNKVQTALWRLKPGTVIPGHYHNHDEDCLILEGEVSFEGHTLYAGDYQRMEKGSEHPDMYTSTGALLYLKHDIHEDLSWLDV